MTELAKPKNPETYKTKFESPSGTKIRKKPTLWSVFFRLDFG